ncbi:hypothetical protein PMA4326_019255 [Pseudomonas syringae pv. maculicola str. ES4326]|uniref:Uncharacterized protein n=1 Tax=Pseudomonas syringae pv. maculicola str. ES4326 TaxID=629265 RepID=A0A8T8C4G9_PSEYM|nr:hypothetical protein PMA4326_019255 [Pseudomonas syringae pv. maculicola str. ES4326]
MEAVTKSDAERHELHAHAERWARWGLWVVGCGLWVVGCGLWVVGCDQITVLLPVLGSSRTSEASPDPSHINRGQVHTSGFCPEGVGASGGYDGCDGLRSGPEIGYL